MTKDGLRCVGGADVETPLDGGADDGGGGGGETSGETSGSLRLPLVWANEATGRQIKLTSELHLDQSTMPVPLGSERSGEGP